jgi:hypothetical protein
MSVAPGTAQSLLQQRANQIMKIQPPHAPPSGCLENIIDAQSAFNALFVNIVKLESVPAASPVSLAFSVAASAPVAPKRSFSENVRLTHEVMNMCSPELLALFADSSLSATASKSLSRLVKSAASQLKNSESCAVVEASANAHNQLDLSTPPTTSCHSHDTTLPAPSPAIDSPSFHGSLGSAFSCDTAAEAKQQDSAAPMLSPSSLFSCFSPPLAPAAPDLKAQNSASVLLDGSALFQRIRTQLQLTPHRATKLKNMMQQWSQNGVVLAGSSAAQTLSPDMTLGQLQYAMQQPCSLNIDADALRDILAALSASASTSLSDLGVFISSASVSSAALSSAPAAALVARWSGGGGAAVVPKKKSTKCVLPPPFNRLRCPIQSLAMFCFWFVLRHCPCRGRR